MIEDQNNLQVDHDTEVYAITPVDVPSENYLVSDHLQRIPNIFAHGIFFIILLLILTAFLYSILSKVDIVIEAKAIARPTSHKINIFCDRDGYIEKIFIMEGQKVEANAPLFLIRSKEALTYRTKANELRIAIPLKQEFYDTKISAAKEELSRLQKNHKKLINLKKLKLEQNQLSLQNIDSDMEYWKSELNLFEDELKRFNILYKKGVVSIRTRNITKVRLEKARTEFEKIAPLRQINLKKHSIIKEEFEKEKDNYLAKKNIIEKEIDNLRLERESTLIKMKQELELNGKMLSIHDNSLVSNAAETDKTIRVKIPGVVSELNYRNIGEYVRQSDLLCTILPTNQPLYMDLTVENKDIGFIETDKKIKYKFNAFPYIDYGVLYGTVISISPSAASDEKHDMVYHIKGTLDNLHFTIDGQNYPIKAGMTATAEIITEKKSIFSILFRRFKKIDSIPK